MVEPSMTEKPVYLRQRNVPLHTKLALGCVCEGQEKKGIGGKGYSEATSGDRGLTMPFNYQRCSRELAYSHPSLHLMDSSTLKGQGWRDGRRAGWHTGRATNNLLSELEHL